MSERFKITEDGDDVLIDGYDVSSRSNSHVRAVIRQLLADLAERDARIADYRDAFSGLCHTLSVGSEGRPEMTASDWRRRVDEGIEFLIRPLQERAERAESELARLQAQEPPPSSGAPQERTPPAKRRAARRPTWSKSCAR
jgi:hypothetical protein